jgi:hypothetical protein
VRQSQKSGKRLLSGKRRREEAGRLRMGQRSVQLIARLPGYAADNQWAWAGCNLCNWLHEAVKTPAYASLRRDIGW